MIHSSNFDISELETQLEILDGTPYKDVSPIHDVVLWKDDQNVWRVVVDTKEDGNLAEAKVLSDFKVDRSWDTFQYVGNICVLNF